MPQTDHLTSALRGRYESQPWAIQEWALESLRSLVSGSDDLIDRPLPNRAAAQHVAGVTVERKAGYTLVGNVAVVPVEGILLKRASEAEAARMGAADYDGLASSVAAAGADPAASVIMLDIYSPGGMVCGCQESANRIRQVAERKETVAFVDTLGASAAYWLAASANSIVVTPSAQLGSIGTVVSFLDSSGLYQKLGLRREVMVGEGATYKGMGAGGTSLTPAQRAHVQQSLDDATAMFRAWVSGRREGKVGGEAMQGQTFRGARAVEAGLADAVVNDFSEMLGVLLAMGG